MSTVQLDRADERITHDATTAGRARAALRNIRSGDLGALPVVIGLVIIAVIFQSLNSVFLSSGNLVNLMLDSAAVGVISLGIVCVLLVGEIDLSVGSVSGFTAAVVAVLFVRHDWNWVLAVVVALGIAGRHRAGVRPGAHPVRDAQLRRLARAAARVPRPPARDPRRPGLRQPALRLLPRHLRAGRVRAAAVARVRARRARPVAVFATGYETMVRRRRANLSATSVQVLAVRSVALLVALEFVVWYLNRERGVGWMVVFFVALVLLLNYAITRTGWGRSLLAVGGNVEAARRSGIPVRGSTSARSRSAPSSPRSGASSPRAGSRRRTSAAAPATSTSTPSRRRSSVARASSAAAAARGRRCWARSSSRRSPTG